MKRDVTEAVNTFRLAASGLWTSVYTPAIGGGLDAEYLSCFYRTARSMFVDLVVYPLGLDYRRYQCFDEPSEAQFYRSMGVTLDIDWAASHPIFMYDNAGNLVPPRADVVLSQNLVLTGFRMLDDPDVFRFVDFSSGEAWPIGVVDGRAVRRYLLEEGHGPGS